MKLVAYLRGLIPSFTLSRVLTDISSTQQELVETTLPVIKVHAGVMGSTALKSRNGKSYDSHFKKHLNYKYSGNLFVAITDALENASTNIPYIRKTVEQNFATDINKESLNIIRLTLLQYVELLSFACSYARRFTYFVTQCEIAEDSKNKVKNSTLPVEVEWLGNNLENFMHALNILKVPKDKLEQTLRNLPNITVNEGNAESVLSISGEKVIDPLGFGLLSISFNPFYRTAMRIAEKQAARHAEAKEEATRLSLQIQQWNVLKSRSDISAEELAKLQKAIDYTEQRVRDAQYKMHKLENDE